MGRTHEVDKRRKRTRVPINLLKVIAEEAKKLNQETFEPDFDLAECSAILLDLNDMAEKLKKDVFAIIKEETAYLQQLKQGGPVRAHSQAVEEHVEEKVEEKEKTGGEEKIEETVKMREGLRLLMKFEPDFEEFLQGRAKLLAVGVDWASHEELALYTKVLIDANRLFEEAQDRIISILEKIEEIEKERQESEPQNRRPIMAPAGDYLYLSIETFINSVSLIIMIPCLSTVIRTQGMHANCKLLLVTSASVQSLILCVQTVLFFYNYITENLCSPTDGLNSFPYLANFPRVFRHENERDWQQTAIFSKAFPDNVRPFLYLQNGLFTMSSYVSLVLVSERVYAVRNAAEYERSGRHLIHLVVLVCGCFLMACLHVYAIYWHDWFYETISIVYSIEACTLIISIVIIIYARLKLKNVPYNEDRLKAKYQIKEVLNFSIAILPSVMVSSVMQTLSLVPTILWLNGIITYPVCCVFYFSLHSLNCIFNKLTLIGCHKGMRHRFQMLFVKRIGTLKGFKRDIEQEGKDYFDQMKAAWDSAPVYAPKNIKVSKIKEVLNFSIAILPSVMVSSVMHTLSLVPTILWLNGIITYPVCCVFYFSLHSLNCIFNKLTLIGCHKGMRHRFQMLFVKRIGTLKGFKRDIEQEGKDYFDQMKAAWDSAPVYAPKNIKVSKVVPI
ncbi:hypothetical protein PRIPAC_97591 [Pristionchus pacificus]|uniref:Uncharacterized protein n=1 Tax=Pristionchus pacificus TaxID=54126 RepID=A0A2A6BY10_PRIPA|nr:hypothetical protein PRIPAC_97591 [Pristionchus pacificus]|eukprot:PDM70663.1 hypothetical protein PRIPAC_43868 [Pristionchus pacificus]